MHLLNSVSNSLGSVLKPAGLENAQGILSANYMKEPGDRLWQEDPAYKDWLDDFMDRYMPGADKNNTLSVYGYSVAQTLVRVLRQCGDQLTRENVMKQAANLKGVQLGMLLPGIVINTSATDFAPIEQMQMMRFSGERWEPFGPVLSGMRSRSGKRRFKGGLSFWNGHPRDRRSAQCQYRNHDDGRIRRHL